ncbi:hypothetical protein KOM00_05950 [Geomonas sp. Red69]|uniref:Uncharacterized protein n=1 Tax=Geomonas diazotrophica TaxID=2843197 RepID=A0ABX8JG96_9BACT|nr:MULTISPECIES: hypothetical protein [Geomonas]MBU5636272.1 hypothetical protein [Geomonas diazotrophica]QWV96166.1 hypothetical protein KP005_12325 [Geomonas nitrogeniifigens]QXE85233.1 hypothetical protein KP003_12605 [Geomonas nitrogeniifigens]
MFHRSNLRAMLVVVAVILLAFSFVAIFVTGGKFQKLAIGSALISTASILWLAVAWNFSTGEIRDKFGGLVVARSAHPFRFWFIQGFIAMLATVLTFGGLNFLLALG